MPWLSAYHGNKAKAKEDFMTDIAATDELFFTRAGLDRSRVQTLVDDALTGTDDGELFLEYRQSESVVFDDGQIKSAAFDTSQGFGLRAISGEVTGYSQASELSEDAILRAGETVKTVCSGKGGTFAAPPGTNKNLYCDDNPLSLVDFETKVKLLADMDAYARGRDQRVAQVTASLIGNWQAMEIMRGWADKTCFRIDVPLRPDPRMKIGIIWVFPCAFGSRL